VVPYWANPGLRRVAATLPCWWLNIDSLKLMLRPIGPSAAVPTW